MGKKGKPVGNASIIIGADSSRFRRGLRRLKYTFRNKLRDLKRTAKIGGLAVGAAFAAGFAKALKSGSRYEAQVLQFAGKMNGKANAERYLKEIEKYSNVTPMTFDDLVKADKQLLGSGRNGVETLRMLGDAVASAGDVENLGGELYEVAQIMGKMYAMGDAGLNINEQIRQLGDRKLLGDHYAEALNAGNPTEQIKVVERALKRHKGYMEALSTTTIGLASTLKGELQGAFRDLGLGILEEARDLIQTLIDAVRRLRQENLAGWAAAIGKIVTALTNMVMALFAGGPARQKLFDDIRTLFGNIAKGFERVAYRITANIVEAIPLLGGKGAADKIRGKAPQGATISQIINDWHSGQGANFLEDMGWKSKAPEQKDFTGAGSSSSVPPPDLNRTAEFLNEAIGPLSNLHAIQAAYAGGTDGPDLSTEDQKSAEMLEELKGSRRAQELMEQHLRRQIDYQERNG